MQARNPRLETVKQLLCHLRKARSGESELLMKEVWEDCESSADVMETERELDLVIEFLENRKGELVG